jgi:ABC-type enterochelin transport system permease subunit
MKSFVVKTLIASIIFYVLFEIVIGSRLDTIQNYFELLKNKQERMEIKEKIFDELEKANKKEQILNEREKKIISEFLGKIQKEINFYNAE